MKNAWWQKGLETSQIDHIKAEVGGKYGLVFVQDFAEHVHNPENVCSECSEINAVLRANDVYLGRYTREYMENS